MSAVGLWLSFRDVSFSGLWAAMRRANLWVLILPSVAAYVLSIWVRAVRWKHLTAAVAPLERGPLFRATAVGFMVNNVFPLRIGEVVRAWYLSKETGVSGSALFGTVIVERVIDAFFVLALAAVVLGTYGIRGLDTRAVLLTLGGIVTVPLVFIGLLRAAPERVIGWAHGLLARLLPDRLAGRIESPLRGLATGLGGLRGARSFFWVFVHSAVLWLVCSTVPFAAAVLSLGIDLGSGWRLVQASLTVLVCVGAAVALPSAPGFVGLYHSAARFGLQPFGVEPEEALALGTLAHAVFWLSLTALGLIVLRFGGGRLDETLSAGSSNGS